MPLCAHHLVGSLLWLQPGQAKAGQSHCPFRTRVIPASSANTALRDVSAGAAGLDTAEPVLRSNPLSYQPALSHRAEDTVQAGEEAYSEGQAESRSKRERNRRSAAVKQRISDGMLLNWHQEPHRRLAVSEKLKGREPWNKGKAMSAETRAKMSRSHTGLKHSPAVRKKMGKAHTGLLHSAETMALISEQQWGRPKSEEHRQKIAAAQARRHAAQRVLKAVEDVHRTASGAEGSGATSSSCPRFPGRAPDTRMTRGSVVKNYKAQLREYRTLQAELAPWTAAFQGQYGRRPHLHDVEVTGITWLITKYKQYLILRERVLSDTNVLRSKLDAAAPDFDGGQARSDAAGGLGSMKSFERFNANGPAGGRQLTMGKVSAALDYQRRQQGSATSSSSPASSTASSDQSAAASSSSSSGSSLGSQDQSQQPMHAGRDPLEGVKTIRDLDPAVSGTSTTLADAVVGPAALHRRQTLESQSQPSPDAGLTSSSGASPISGSGEAARSQSMGAADFRRPAAASPEERSVPKARPLPSARAAMPARVRAAVKAAEQYRQSKLKATVDAANAAAACAAVPPSRKSKSAGAGKAQASQS